MKYFNPWDWDYGSRPVSPRRTPVTYGIIGAGVAVATLVAIIAIVGLAAAQILAPAACT